MAWLTINFESQALHMPVMLEVWLPQGRGGYKQLYLLHGAGGDHTSWLTKSRAADYADGKNIALIMPSGKNRCYVNNLYGKEYFTFITEELIEKCEGWFSLSREKNDRYIAGMSMGGYGAVHAALHKPQLYRAAFSYSGLLDIYKRFQKPEGLDLSPVFGSKDEFCTEKYDLFEVVHKFTEQTGCFVENAPDFVLTCGDKDKRIDMTENLYNKMQEEKIPSALYIEAGNHNWEYWDKCIANTINWISKENSLKNEEGKGLWQ